MIIRNVKHKGLRLFMEADDNSLLPAAVVAKIRAMKRPAHPGGFIRSKIIDDLALTVTAAAAALGVTRPALSALLNERADLSPEMALRIEKAFGVSMETLMRMQNSFDIAAIRD